MWLGMLVAVMLLLVCVGVLYWLLKSMGEDGVEAAAPGSCRSGRCGVTPKIKTEGSCASAPASLGSAQPTSLGSVTLGSVSWGSGSLGSGSWAASDSLKAKSLTANSPTADSLTDEINRKDALSPKQTL